MNVLDIVLAALLIFGFARGLWKGFFVELASLIGLIAGIYGAIHFSFFVANLMSNYVSWEARYMTIVSFAITFLIIVVVITLLGKALTKIADFASLGLLNKILGGVFGMLKTAIILSIVLLIFSKLGDTLPFISDELQEEAVLYKPVKDLAPTLFPSFVKVVKEKSDDFEVFE